MPSSPYTFRLDDDVRDDLKREAKRRGLDDIAPLVREYISAGLAHFDPTVNRMIDSGERTEALVGIVSAQQKMMLSLATAALGTLHEMKVRSTARLPDESDADYKTRLQISFDQSIANAIDGAPKLFKRVAAKLDIGVNPNGT